MKKITNGKIFALCLGDFARGLINGIITTYLLTFFIPTNSNTTLPQFFVKAALTMAIIRGIGTVIDAVTDPWVASLSDNSKERQAHLFYALVCYPLRAVLPAYLLPARGGFERYKRHMGRRDARALLPVLDAL